MENASPTSASSARDELQPARTDTSPPAGQASEGAGWRRRHQGSRRPGFQHVFRLPASPLSTSPAFNTTPSPQPATGALRAGDQTFTPPSELDFDVDFPEFGSSGPLTQPFDEQDSPASSRGPPESPADSLTSLFLLPSRDEHAELNEDTDGTPDRLDSDDDDPDGDGIDQVPAEAEARSFHHVGTISNSCPVNGCNHSSDDRESLRKHIKKHPQPMRPKIPTAILAPIGLTACPYCDHLFDSVRGIANHVARCPSRNLLSLADHLKDSGQDVSAAPIPCWVWWLHEKSWYPGMATEIESEGGDKQLLHLKVSYDDGTEDQIEAIGNVTFEDPSDLLDKDHDGCIDSIQQHVEPAVTPSRQARQQQGVRERASSPASSVRSEDSNQNSPPNFTPIELPPTGIDPLSTVFGNLYSDFPRFDTIPNTKAMESPLQELAATKRRVASVPRHPDQWGQELKESFVKGCYDFAPYLHNMLQLNTEVATFQAILEFNSLAAKLLEAHGMHRGQHRDDQQHEPGQPDANGLTDELRWKARVSAHAYSADYGKAAQEFGSNGVAPPSDEVADTLRNMHKPPKGDLELPPVDCDQLIFTGKQATKFLKRLCTKDRKSRGVFGWSTSMLALFKGCRPLPHCPPFLRVVGELVARVASAQLIHETTAFSLTVGELVALHKDNLIKRTARKLQQLPLQLRPVNIGSRLLAWAFKLALKAAEITSFLRTLIEIQLGISAKRGPEILAHFLWAKWNSGDAILVTDQRNAFNEIDRNAMLEAVHRNIPGITRLFNTFYGIISMCLFFVDGSPAIIWSCEGSRMGCVGGSFCFDLTVHPAYEGIRDRDAARNHDQPISIRAHTDDAPITIPTPRPGEVTDDSVADFYERVGLILDDARELLAEVSLTSNREKCKLLVPDHIPDPPDGPDRGFDVVRGGVDVAGVPIGVTRVDSFFEDWRRLLSDKLQATKLLHPQVAIGLIARSFIPSCFYAFQVTPSCLTEVHAAAFDDLFTELRTDVLSPPTLEQPVPHSSERQTVANYIAQLPRRCDGGGLTSLAAFAKSAYWASLASSINDDEPLQQVCESLADFATAAHDLLLRQLTDHGPLDERTAEIFPISDPLAVLRPGDFYHRLFTSNKIRLQKSLAQLVQGSQRQQLLNHIDQNGIGWVQSEDIVELQTHGARRSHSLVLNLSIPGNRWSPAEFISYSRKFLLLPQLPHLGNAEVTEGYDYPVESCLADCHTRDRELTPPKRRMGLHGGHARSNCPCCKTGTHFAHNSMKATTQTAGVTAGLLAGNEPTHQALLDEHGPDKIDRLFPKKSSKAKAEASCTLITALFEAKRIDSRQERAAALGQVQRDLIAINQPASGLRLDCNLTDPAHEIPGLLIDVATVDFAAAKNHRPEYLLALKRARAWANDPLGKTPANLRGSPAMAATTARKQLRYKPLMHAIKEQIDAGERQGAMPVFTALVVSTMGHVEGFGPLKAALEKGYMRTLTARGPRDDGQSPSVLTSVFLSGVRSSLIVAAQRGMAKSMLAAGRPYSRRNY